MKKGMIGDVPGNVLGMLGDLAQKLQHGAIRPEQLELFLKKKNPFANVSELTADWEVFYREHFRVEKDFSKLSIPKKQKGFDRLIVVAEGMTPNKIFARLKELMPTSVFKWWDKSDKVISDRMADKEDYAIWVRDRVEADEELKNKSANDLKKEDIPGITLGERLLYELKFFDETGKHLDVDNWTICAGSRGRDGDVPRVHWYDGEVSVNWDGPGHRRDYIRARAVVS